MSKYRIAVGFPGPSMQTEVSFAYHHPSREHEYFQITQTGADNFDALWCTALNLAERGQCTHYAQIHSDVNPGLYWADPLLRVMDRRCCGVVGAAIAMKDALALLSVAIGDPEDPWCPLRRLTCKEALQLPEDFDAAELGYPGYPLLWNHGCFVADLRLPQWTKTNVRGELIAHWDYRRRVIRDPKTGEWTPGAVSEDYHFSRMAWQLKVPAAVCRLINWHRGVCDYGAHEPWAEGWAHDEMTRHKWEKFPGPVHPALREAA